MSDLSRRELLVSMLQALFMALFPWLRGSPRGLEVARAGAENVVRSVYKPGTWNLSIGIRGYELAPEDFKTFKAFESWPELMAAADATPGPKFVMVDNSAGPAIIPAGEWDVSDMKFVAGEIHVQDGATVSTGISERVLDMDEEDGT